MITPTQMKRQRTVLSTGYVSYGKNLFRYAFSKTHNKDLTEDLIQSTFLKTWMYLVKGGKVDMMEAFLFHILKALIIDGYRKRKTGSLDLLIEKGFEPSFDETERLINALDGEKVVALIGKLPVQYQKIIRMRYIQDLSLKEISAITGKKRNTVAVQAHRGLKKLKTLYKIHALSMQND